MDKEKQSKLRAEFENHLNSPLPLLIRLRNVVFGKVKPDLYTQLSFFFALVLWFVFFLWSVMGSVVIRTHLWIEAEKKIQVSKMIDERGIQLGFEPQSFIGRLEAFYALGIILWLVAFIGLILMWRKNFRFVWFFFGGAGLYLLFMLVMLGFDYWANDTTLFDKVSYFLLVGHTAFYAYYLKKEQDGEPIQFFGVDLNGDDED